MGKNIVLIGAASAQFGVRTLNDLYNSQVLNGSTITLFDINEKELQHVHKAGLAYKEEHNIPCTLLATTNRKEALKDADFIVISIEVGNRFDLWNQDWKVPMQYGIRQVYGENGGAGGTFHALRIIPVFLEICKDIAEICPKAYIFNYSNPMTAICTTIKRVYPELNFIGMCHEIASLRRYLPTILDTPFEELELQAAGLNHFSMLLQAYYKKDGTNAYPDILKKAPAFFEKEPGYSDLWAYIKEHDDYEHVEGSHKRFNEAVSKSAFTWPDRTLFKYLLETYQLMPITTDSHMGEYVSWAYDRSDHRGIEDFYQLYTNTSSKIESKFGLGTDERVIPIIEGIVQDEGYIESAVNVLNREPGAAQRAIEDLPDWIAVEVPAKITSKGLEAQKVDIPKGFCALLQNYVGAYDLITEAVIHKNKHMVLQSLLANPVVHSSRGLAEMIDQMIDMQSPWLDYLR